MVNAINKKPPTTSLFAWLLAVGGGFHGGVGVVLYMKYGDVVKVQKRFTCLDYLHIFL